MMKTRGKVQRALLCLAAASLASYMWPTAALANGTAGAYAAQSTATSTDATSPVVYTLDTSDVTIWNLAYGVKKVSGTVGKGLTVQMLLYRYNPKKKKISNKPSSIKTTTSSSSGAYRFKLDNAYYPLGTVIVILTTSDDLSATTGIVHLKETDLMRIVSKSQGFLGGKLNVPKKRFAIRYKLTKAHKGDRIVIKVNGKKFVRKVKKNRSKLIYKATCRKIRKKRNRCVINVYNKYGQKLIKTTKRTYMS